MTKKHFQTLAECLGHQAAFSGWSKETMEQAIHAVATACMVHNAGFKFERFNAAAKAACERANASWGTRGGSDV